LKYGDLLLRLYGALGHRLVPLLYPVLLLPAHPQCSVWLDLKLFHQHHFVLVTKIQQYLMFVILLLTPVFSVVGHPNLNQEPLLSYSLQLYLLLLVTQ
jgi:hypothetical protein